ncbi:MAG: Na+:solute symporter, partial [Bacteroidota bacterium]
GLVAASLIGAFMSTMSTQLNLGASYLVNDFYKRFIKPDASEKQLLGEARVFTVISAILGLGLGILLTNAGQAFNLLLLLGAGTGLIYILRWFWWRINATTEVVAMIASLIIASLLTFTDNPLEDWHKIVLGAVLTTLTWVIATFLTPNTDENVLINFYQKIKPGGNGWNYIIEKARAKGVTIDKSKENLPIQLLSFVIGCITVYAALFATGSWIYGESTTGLILTLVALGGGFILFNTWKKVNAN